jgi:hypothetical protein
MNDNDKPMPGGRQNSGLRFPTGRSGIMVSYEFDCRKLSKRLESVSTVGA